MTSSIYKRIDHESFNFQNSHKQRNWIESFLMSYLFINKVNNWYNLFLSSFISGKIWHSSLSSILDFGYINKTYTYQNLQLSTKLIRSHDVLNIIQYQELLQIHQQIKEGSIMKGRVTHPQYKTGGRNSSFQCGKTRWQYPGNATVNSIRMTV